MALFTDAAAFSDDSSGLPGPNSITESMLTTTGVIDRQVTGVGGAQDIQIVVDGNADEVITVDGYGETAGIVFTVRINDNATVVEHQTHESERSTAVMSSGTTVATWAGPMALQLVFFTKLINAQGRVGFGKIIHALPVSSKQGIIQWGMTWPNTLANIALITLHAHVAAGFKQNFLTTTRRRKLSA